MGAVDLKKGHCAVLYQQACPRLVTGNACPPGSYLQHFLRVQPDETMSELMFRDVRFRHLHTSTRYNFDSLFISGLSKSTSIWLVVSSHSNNIRQIGSSSPIDGKMKAMAKSPPTRPLFPKSTAPSSRNSSKRTGGQHESANQRGIDQVDLGIRCKMVQATWDAIGHVSNVENT